MASTGQKAAGIGVVTVVAGLIIGGPNFIGALNKVEKQELVVYADRLANGLPTVCSGHTDWKLRVGTAYTKADCDTIDMKTATKYGLAIIECTGHGKAITLNQHQFDALTLFAVNVGIAGACEESRAVKLVRQGRFAEGCRAMATGPDGKPAWSYGTDKNGNKFYIQGLQNRRLFERDWCLKPMPAPELTETATA